MATPPDEELAQRARAGSRDAFAAIVARYQHRIYRTAMRLAHNASDAEEITQETLLHAHRSIASFRGDAQLSTWLCRIAVNEALMRRRSAARRPVQSLEALRPGVTEASASTVDDALSEDRLDRRRTLDRVRRALDELDEGSRAALVLRDLEELSAEEAANVLGISTDAVRQRAHRARLKLREVLRETRAAA